MKLKKGLENSTSEFWYDLTKGGYIKPLEMCESSEDAKKKEVIEDFERSCEEQIEGFLQ